MKPYFLFIQIVLFAGIANATPDSSAKTFAAQCSGEDKIVAGSIQYPAVSAIKPTALTSNIYLQLGDETTWQSWYHSGSYVTFDYSKSTGCYGLTAPGQYSLQIAGQTYVAKGFGPTDMNLQYFGGSSNSDVIHGGFVYCNSSPQASATIEESDVPKSAKKLNVEKWAVKSDVNRQSMAQLFNGMAFTVHYINSFGNGVTVWFKFANAKELTPLYYIKDDAFDDSSPPFETFNDTHAGVPECKIQLK